MGTHKIANTPAIRRLPVYYHRLIMLQQQGEVTVSTSSLAKYVELDPIVVRKDLELTGAKGDRGIGYKVSELIDAIREYLGWNIGTRACLVGVGALGTALLGFSEFAEYGLNIVTAFDSSPERIGTEVCGRIVQDVGTMEALIAREHIEMAILCVPGPHAQRVADELVKCGVREFWNFSNTCIQLPPDVIVQREVISGGFAVLCRKCMEHRTHSPMD